MKQAFTLIELLVVIAIIGVISTLSIVSFSSARERARIANGLNFEAQLLRSLGDEVVGRWDFDDCSGTTVNDVSGYKGDATLFGNATWSTDTPNGKGCSLNVDGTASTYARVNDADRFSFTDNVFTISFWMKASDTTSMKGVLGKGGAGQYEYSFYGTTVMEFASWELAGMTSVYVRPSTSYDTKWNQIVITADGTNIFLYKNGTLISKLNIYTGRSFGNGSGYLYLGSGYDGAGNRYFIGLIDNVRIYRRSLSAREVHNLYTESSSEDLTDSGLSPLASRP